MTEGPLGYAGDSVNFVDRQPDCYLIAFTEHTIRAAVHYWVEDEMIHWITRERQERQAPLSEVDHSGPV
jgi:hypothetical protein